MSKLKLTQAEIDKLVTVERIDALPTVHGVGCNDVQFQIKIDRKNIWQYRLWKDMIQRGYDVKTKSARPTYKDVTCCDEWLSFANFVCWVNKEVGYSGKPDGYQLDKDLILRGNKHYSPEACSLVPRAVNALLNSNGNSRGRYPVGVHFDVKHDGFAAGLRCGGVRKNIGLFATPEEAFLAYKIAKEAHIKVVALQHKDILKPAVFESLMGWEINIDG